MDANNSKEILKYRKAQNTLIIAGAGIILMSVWTAVKTTAILILKRADFVAMIRKVAGDSVAQVKDADIYMAAMTFMGIYILAAVLLQIFVGYSAFSEGRGKRHYVYLPLAFLMTFRKYDLILDDLDNINKAGGKIFLRAGTGPVTILALALVELTSLILLIEMFVAVYNVKRYRYLEKRRKQEAVGE